VYRLMKVHGIGLYSVSAYCKGMPLISRLQYIIAYNSIRFDKINKRKINFLNKVSTTRNALCKLFVSTASSEMITLCSATYRPVYITRLSCDYWL